MKEIDRKNVKSILVIGSIGIGNLLLFSSSLKILRKSFPASYITVVVLKSSFKYLYEHNKDVNEIIVIPSERKVGLKERFGIIKRIRAKKPDLCITTFPANRWEYNLLAFLSGAKLRIAHRYNNKYFRSLSFLQNMKTNVIFGLHDLEQNLELIKLLGIEYEETDKRLIMDISEEDIKFSDEYLCKNKIKENDFLVGFHPGSSFERGMYLKRWEAEKFAELGDRLTEKYNAKVLVFGGNDEVSLKKKIYSLMKNKPVVVDNLSIGKVSGLIKRCNLFITNDSGLMHIAVASNVKTLAIFGPTDPSRTAPYGKGHIVIRKGLPCSPCWSIYNVGVGKVKCIHQTNECLKNISVEEVFQKVKEMVER